MEFSQIRAFLAVAEHLHFGRAAQELHIAQPPLTRSIQQLENALGVPLFVRTTRSVSLTAAGQAFLKPARKALDSLRHAELAALAAGNGESGIVRIAFAGASSHVMVGSLSKLVTNSVPGIELELLSGNFAQPALERVISEDVDIALARWRSEPSEVHARTVGRETFVLAVHPDHRLATRAEVSLTELSGEEFVSLPHSIGSVLSEPFMDPHRRKDFSPHIVQFAPDTWTVLSLVAAGIGVALTVSSVPENNQIASVRFLKVADAGPEIELRLGWLKSNSNPALKKVLQLTEALFPAPPPPCS